ncbi:response regulator [Paenibacillus koleovorans]|uniref:response regulator n=1 Tax=Paenibacillus koleovorans TaxID=121608 RepID=UPI000FD7C440|nr:response regulator [Paenibacillus koleovorans]
MYKVLIVDDEKHVRDRMMQTFPWGELGFEVTGSVENGGEALKLLRAGTPDLVCTDIMMPDVNGLELAKHIHEQHPRIKVVILSAYDDFKYAQDAIRYGVKGYLLKPLVKGEFIEVFRRMADELDRDNRDEGQLNRQEALLIRLLKGSGRDEGEWQRQATALFGPARYIRIVICAVEQLAGTEPSSLWQQAIMRKSQEFWKRLFAPVLFYGNHLVVFLHDTRPISKQDIKDQLHRFKERLHDDLTAAGLAAGGITIGVGNAYDGIEHIAKSYNEAIYAGSFQFFRGKDAVIFKQDLAGSFDGVRKADDDRLNGLIDELVDSVLTRSEHEVVKAHTAFFAEMEQSALYSIQDIRMKSSEAYLLLLLKAKEKKIGLAAPKKQEALETIQGFGTLHELKLWYRQELAAFSRGREEYKPVEGNRYILAAKDYVEKHYPNKVRLEEIAEQLHINPSYFSSIFKKATGENFIDYVNGVRIAKAAQFIYQTDHKISEISMMVGFDNFSYFNKIFKKKTGVTPLMYRAQGLPEHHWERREEVHEDAEDEV